MSSASNFHHPSTGVCLTNPTLLEALRNKILPELIEYSNTHNKELRVWVVGCATGEVAYGLAMLLADVLGDALNRSPIKIFATDQDENVINFARQGVYPQTLLDVFPEQWVASYCIPVPDGYKISKQIRDLLIFARRNLEQAIPFTRIDLLIYSNCLDITEKKSHLISQQVINYSLMEGGYLVVDPDIEPNLEERAFSPYLPEAGIYKKLLPVKSNQKSLTEENVVGSLSKTARLNSQIIQKLRQEIRVADIFRNTLLKNLPVGVVVVDHHYDIREINWMARKLLGIYNPAIGEDIVHLAVGLPERTLGLAIDRSIREQVSFSLEPVRVQLSSDDHETVILVNILPQPWTFTHDELPENGALILVTDITHETNATLNKAAKPIPPVVVEDVKNTAPAVHPIYYETQLEKLSEELRQTKELLDQEKRRSVENERRLNLQIERLTNSNLNLLATNEILSNSNELYRNSIQELYLKNEDSQNIVEEYQVINEELQSSNEELESLTEELHTSVEELNFANNELTNRTEELNLLNRLLLKQKLESEQARLQLETILAGIADAVLVVDRNGEPVLTNIAYQELFGADEVILLDDTGEKVLSPELFPLVQATGDTGFCLNFILVTGDGQRHWCEAVGQPILDENGKPKLSVVVFHDSTERVLRQFEEKFLALANHELRTPLTAIKGYLEMVKKWLGEKEDNQKALRGIGIALVQANQLARLINDLGDVIRLQNDRFTLVLEPVYLSTLLKQVLETTQILAPNYQIRLEAGDKTLRIQGDSQRLQQVFLNLLNNAIIHAEGSNVIDVRFYKATPDTVVIEVEDYGIGITPENLRHLFSRHFQIKSGKSSKMQGMGLGLYIAQQIVQAHGGELLVNSTPGKGSIFKVLLPLSKPSLS